MKKIFGILICMLFIGASIVPSISGNLEEKQNVNMQKVKNVESVSFGFIFVFGGSVDVKIVHIEPGDNYVDLEVLNKPLYIWENEIITINPGAFVRLNEAKGLFLPSFPLCIGICNDYGIIG